MAQQKNAGEKKKSSVKIKKKKNRSFCFEPTHREIDNNGEKEIE